VTGFEKVFATSTPSKPIPAIRKSIINKGNDVKTENLITNNISTAPITHGEKVNMHSIVDSENEFGGSVSNKTSNQEVLDGSVMRLKGGKGSEHGSPRKEGDASIKLNTVENTGDIDMEIASLIESMEIATKGPKSRLISLNTNEINTDSELSSDEDNKEPYKRNDLRAGN